MKYRLNITTSLIIEAESHAGAVAEVEAMRVSFRNRDRLPADEERDLLLNAIIEEVNEVEPTEE
jgi:hypothetical protein